MKPININDKLALINDHWNPRIAADLNGQQIRFVKILGAFPFHKHEHEDEMFFVVKGKMRIDFEDHFEEVNQNEFLIVPANVIHRPVAEQEVELMMFVTQENINTGNLESHTLKKDTKKLKKI